MGELEKIAREVSRPLLVNMLFGGKTPILPVSRPRPDQIKIAVAPIESLLVTVKAVRELVEAFREEGTVLSKEKEMISFAEIEVFSEWTTIRESGLRLRVMGSHPSAGSDGGDGRPIAGCAAGSCGYDSSSGQRTMLEGM